jgi:hypothetical protein
MNNKVGIEILNANIHAIMEYKGTENTQHKCTICRFHLMTPTCEDVDKCEFKRQISRGKCGHFFHTGCINKHNKSDNMSCPIDLTTWTLDKILDTNSKQNLKKNNNLNNNSLKKVYIANDIDELVASINKLKIK